MTIHRPGRRSIQAALSSLMVLAVAVGPVFAGGFKRKRRCCQPCPQPVVVEAPSEKPAEPAEPQAEPEEPTSLPFDAFAALSEPTVALVDANGGYLDNAVIRNRVRLRFDNASGNEQPSRAEYFYPKCGCFRFLPTTNPARDPNAFGPRLLDVRGLGHVDYQEYKSYFELAPVSWMSAFVEIGLRDINPHPNDNTGGLGDTQTGFKMYLLSRDQQHLTFQLKMYIPTGDSDRGLGTNHFSIEPGLLFYKRIDDRITLEGELKDWISVGGTNYGGNVLQYGAGVGYDVYRCNDRYITPIAELVGWTVLSGLKSDITAPRLTTDAAGDTIVNLKLGARVGRGIHSVYAGYGFAMTGDEWYREIVRVEYRMNF